MRPSGPLKRRSRSSWGSQERGTHIPPGPTTFSDADLIKTNDKLLELHTVFANALDESGRLAQLAEHISTLQRSFQRLRISLEQTNRPFENYDGFQRTLLSCDLFIQCFMSEKKGQSWSCGADHVARLETEIMMQVSLLSTSTIVLLAETFFSKDDREPSNTKPRGQPTPSGRGSTPDPEFEDLWEKIKRVVYRRKRKLLPDSSNNNGPVADLEREVQSDLRQLMLKHQPAPDATPIRGPHLPKISHSTPLNLEALPDDKLLERAQQQVRFLRSASGQPTFPRAVQQVAYFAPVPPARVYTLPDDYDAPPEKKTILRDGVIFINGSKLNHFELSRVEYIIDKKRKLKCIDINEKSTIIHDLPLSAQRYPITHHPDKGGPEVSFPELLHVEVKGHKPMAGEALISYSFSQLENTRLLQEMIRDKDLLRTFPVNEMISSDGTIETSFENLKIWKDHKTGEYTLSIRRNLIDKKPHLELPLGSLKLVDVKKPKNNKMIQLEVVQDSHPLRGTLSDDPSKVSSNSQKRTSVVSLKTNRSDSTVRHKEQMRDVGASMKSLSIEFRTFKDASDFHKKFENAKIAQLREGFSTPSSPNSSIFTNPSPLTSPIQETPAQTSGMPGGLADELPPPMIQPSEVILRPIAGALVRTTEIFRSCDDYTVGWICALSAEMAAAIAMLDERHPRLPQDCRDKNAYEIGRIGDHNVVITCLPAGMTGNNSAAAVATRMAYSFPKLSIRLMVGIGGGVPLDRDIRLGDVVVSKPGRHHGGVVQYDFGKTIIGGLFEKTGSLPPPPPALLAATAHLEAIHANFGSEMPKYLKAFDTEYLKKDHWYPGPDRDELFEADYNHVQGEPTCKKCDRSRLQPRSPRNPGPYVHYGAIASGNQVMRDAISRDEIGKRFGVLCFEMEAAGLMNMDTFPCIVIRGICDYADTHKNKEWQGYAAATAAAYAKELLMSIPPSHSQR